MAFPPPQNKIHGRPSILRLHLLGPPQIYSEHLLEVSFTPKLTTHDPHENRLQLFFRGETTERVHGHPNHMCKPQGDLRGFMHGFMPIGQHGSQWFSESILLGFSLLPLETHVWSVRLFRCLSKYIFSMGPFYYSSFCFVASYHDNLCMARILNVDLPGGTPLLFFPLFFFGSACHDNFL
jgi:hypothetical protein